MSGMEPPVGASGGGGCARAALQDLRFPSPGWQGSFRGGEGTLGIALSGGGDPGDTGVTPIAGRVGLMDGCQKTNF